MTPLPGALGGRDLVVWRLDRAVYAADWDRGEGAFRLGGRWNSRGVRAVYCALDPATAILEVAVHRGFESLDLVPHVLTAALIADPGTVFVLGPDSVPNPHWLNPGVPGRGQQQFGDALLKEHDFVVLPSVVSQASWNLLFDPDRASSRYALREQRRFALDPRLHPPAPG